MRNYKVDVNIYMNVCNGYEYIHTDTIAINIDTYARYVCMVVQCVRGHHALAKCDRSAPVKREQPMQDYRTAAGKRP